MEYLEQIARIIINKTTELDNNFAKSNITIHSFCLLQSVIITIDNRKLNSPMLIVAKLDKTAIKLSISNDRKSATMNLAESHPALVNDLNNPNCIEELVLGIIAIYRHLVSIDRIKRIGLRIRLAIVITTAVLIDLILRNLMK